MCYTEVKQGSLDFSSSWSLYIFYIKLTTDDYQTREDSWESLGLQGDQSWVFTGLMLMLKLQYFGHLMRRANSFEKTLMLGGEGDDRAWDGWMASLTRWTWVWVNSGSWWWTWRPGLLWFMGLQRVGHDWTTELNWTTYVGLIKKLIRK